MTTDVKPGYKQTEVGMIPEEWKVVTAGEVGRFRGGNGFPLKWQGRTNGAYPFFKVSDMNNEGNETFMTTANHRISEETRKHLGATAFLADSIVFAKVGAAIFLERKKILGQPSCIDNNMTAFVLDTRRADIRFIHTLLLTTKLGELVATTALPSLSGKQLGQIILGLPPLPEQRAIAGALSDVDALLGVLDQLIAKKRDLKQAAMQQLLTGQTRLPGFHGEWEVKRLGDVVEKLVGGGTPSRSNPAFWGKEVPWVTVKDFATYHPRQTQESITRIGLKNSASHLIPAGTLITSTRMALGKAVIYDVDVAINQDLKAIFIKPSSNVHFLYYWFEHNVQMIDELGSGSTVKGISITELRRLPFLLPTLPEQTAIAEVLSDMDAELAALEQRRAKTRALKQGMMQELLTGRTRLV